MFDLKPDYEQVRQRIEAFWHQELIDRPVTMMTLARPPDEQVDWPASHHTSPAERWMDAQYQAELALVNLSNTEFLGDALPIVFPNLGPEVFSAFYGCEMHFGDYGTSWSDPNLHDWAEVDKIQFDWNSPYLRKLHEMTDAMIEVGKGKFITGMTDWHPGGDAIAAFRDPQTLAMDLIDQLPEVKALLARLEADYFKVYDIFYDKVRAAGLPATSWTPLIHDGKYYIPSNDFSIMISKAMFDDVFLPGITRECQYIDRSIYHLDGPGALRHLDSILAIKELNALQWVFGAGNEGYERWVWVYQKCQKAGKGIQVNCDFSEIPMVMETLDPHGLYLAVSGTPDKDSALAMLKALEKWTVGK